MRLPNRLFVATIGIAILCIIPLSIIRSANPPSSLQFDHTEYDFGKVHQKTVVKHSFPFRNSGREVLDITGVKKSCGCLKAESTVNRLLPNETGEIEVEYASSDARGLVKQHVVVTSSAPDNPYVRLEFTAQVVTDIVVQPASLVFGRVPWGTESTQKIKIRDGGSGIMQAKGIVSKHPLVTVSGFAFNENEEAPSYSAFVHLSPLIPPGYFSGSVEVLTNLDNQKKIEIPVSAWIHGNVTVSPESIRFGIVNKWNPPVPRTVLIQSSKDDLGVEKVTADVNTEASCVELASGSSWRFSVTAQLKPSVTIGTIKGEIVVETNDPVQKNIRIPYSATIQNDVR